MLCFIKNKVKIWKKKFGIMHFDGSLIKRKYMAKYYQENYWKLDLYIKTRELPWSGHLVFGNPKYSIRYRYQ